MCRYPDAAAPWGPGRRGWGSSDWTKGICTMRSSLRRLVTLCVVTLLGLCLQTSPASADPTYQLISIGVDGAVTPTSSATLHYAFDGEVPLRLEARFINKATGAASVIQIPITTPIGSATITWDARWPAGRYELLRIILIDRQTPFSFERYEADGQVFRAREFVGTHSVDFSAVGYSLTGPQTGELTPPRLLSASLAKRVLFGGPITLHVTTADERPDLTSVIAYYLNATPTPADDALVDRAAVPVGTATLDGFTAFQGRQTLDRISLLDRSGSTVTYFRDGRVLANGWYFPEKHHLDFSALDLGAIRHAPRNGRTPSTTKLSSRESQLRRGKGILTDR